MAVKAILGLTLFFGIQHEQIWAQEDYQVTLKTADELWAGTSARVFVKLYGRLGTSKKIELQIDPDYGISKGSTLSFGVSVGVHLDEINQIEVSHDNTGSHPGWLLKGVVVRHGSSGRSFYFPIDRWLDSSSGHSTTIQAEHTPFPRENCGIASTSRVINGREAKANSWPWMGKIVGSAFIVIKSGCGGTLIHPQYVLTAAHCLRRLTSPSKYQVTFGEHDISVVEGYEQYSSVEQFFIHPDYQSGKAESDIALMKLSSPVKINSKVKIACLPKKRDFITQGTTCIATGWGRTAGMSSASSKLREVNLPVANQRRCDYMFKTKVTSKMVCAGGNYKGLCKGDSGGPLLCKDSQQRYNVHGVTSFGDGNCSPRYFTVFSRVTSFVDWIENIISTEVRYV